MASATFRLTEIRRSARQLEPPAGHSVHHTDKTAPQHIPRAGEAI